MHMIEEIVREVAGPADENMSEYSECKRLMRMIESEMREKKIDIPRDRWLAICAHLLAFVRRMASGEKLPQVEAELFEEIHPEMLSLSSRVLFGEETCSQEDGTEVFLLAVHFEAIRANQGK
ncbi:MULTISPECIES: hypothetical protein [Brevibacillus]|jgi:PRD domain protein (TIGR03582 family)|uniref:PRD domain-containing protein n=1 Tax=Brevibacillus borstelensis AK1 TaxID=1300222 RepID=M8DHG1_9BACL|nr:hypothetical protein [Brevibacillus borstelensis]EMT52882.1 hypothetical protein I532_08882 [Brevibacillus borstelensis AK1]KKX55705.1 hypothetical protein X546_08565 [Brevibacillus borstelensis cifa_chp40]MBE5397144.1 hypothetical protein [Brevibacillus borstelensis]MCC0564859.1 hypothetical protein [Brevibacillus borstelensis]MCM3470676.1 hypothetical protein [Brevibacillus borstelensis]